ncbi:unnamed protein product [Meloidogyne enterolobii]|uniref:Uncharacterized protein n=1 Tax=Meloidogyne enterolobii TaxID=390850 RepID=A0ACB0XRM2_MELEN
MHIDLHKTTCLIFIFSQSVIAGFFQKFFFGRGRGLLNVCQAIVFLSVLSN